MIYNFVVENWYLGIFVFFAVLIGGLKFYPKEDSMYIGMLAFISGMLWSVAILIGIPVGIFWCLIKGIEFLVRGKCE